MIVTGALAPYTHVLYERLAERLDRPLHVLSCTKRESARQWVVEAPRLFRHEVLPGLRWHRDAVRNLYVNPAVVTRLAALRPAALVLNDFSPTMLMAAGFARLRRIPYLIRTDGVPETDPGQRSAPHRWLRRAIVAGARAGIGPSLGSARLLALYGVAPERFATSPLFPAWSPAGPPPPDAERPYDVLFCGILNEEVKGARFFTDVILACAARGRRLRVRVAGDGPLRAEMEARLAAAEIEAQFDGYLTQAALPAVYASSRLFLFPSRGDVWGIVVHEALQSGTPVLASPHSGIARELLEGHLCGEVRPSISRPGSRAPSTCSITPNDARPCARRPAARCRALPRMWRRRDMLKLWAPS
ncbi:glycosyltransferase family 4 protein [Methylorubrum suomiense]